MTTRLQLFEPGFTTPFDSAFRRFFSPARFDTDVQTLDMRIDVSEKENAYIVKADIPGVRKEDINVRIDGNVVQIDAEVKHEKESKDNGGKVLRSERYYGTVSRTFSLGQDVDEAKADAKYVDGVLTLELPKKASAASKKLAVH
jgi:HSP20 family protein